MEYEKEWDEDVEKPEVPEEDNSVEGLAYAHRVAEEERYMKYYWDAKHGLI